MGPLPDAAASPSILVALSPRPSPSRRVEQSHNNTVAVMVVAAFAEKRTRENVHEHKNRAFSGDTGSYRGQMFGAELIATVYRKDRKGGREGTPLLASFHLVSLSSPPRVLLVLIAVTRVESCLLLHKKSSFSFFFLFSVEGRREMNAERRERKGIVVFSNQIRRTISNDIIEKKENRYRKFV